MTRFTAVRLLASVSILSACSDFVPPPNPEPLGIQTIGVGNAVQVILSSSDSFRVFKFPSAVDSVYAVEVAPGSGTVTVTVLDSIHLTSSGFVLASSSTAPGQRWTQTVQGVASDPWLIRVKSGTPGQPASVTITVHQVATGPEHVAAAILLDTVYGAEALDAYDDVDRFTFTGSAGQLVEPFLQGTAPADSGQEVCLTLDTLAAAPLAVSFSRAGDTAREPPATGRVLLPRTRSYRVEIKSSRNGCATGAGSNDPYLGPYLMVMRTIDTLPELAADSFAVGDTVNGEAIDPIGDVDVFQLHGSPGQLVNLQLQVPLGGLRRYLQVAVSGATTPDSTSSSGPDTSLDEHGTGRFALPASGRVTVRVTGGNDGRGGDAGPYRLYAYPVNAAPEHLPAAITPGDTIAGESIDHMGDVDEFTFSATQDQQFDVFFQATGVSPFVALILEVVEPSGAFAGETFGYGNDTTLLVRSTGRFTARVTGTYTVRIQGQNDQSPLYDGAYRFLVYPVNPAPESAPAVLAFGDSISSEKIDFPGDVDEFHVVVTDSSGANLVLRPDSTAANLPLQMVLFDSTHQVEVLSIDAVEAGFPQQSQMSVTPGHYILRVQGDPDALSLYRGGYSVRFYKFSFLPETAPDTVVVGDTVAGETINPPGDVDRFIFKGTKGEHINIAIQGLGVPSPPLGNFSLSLAPSPSGPAYVVVSSPTSPDSLGAHATSRLDLPYTGTYLIGVSGEASTNPLLAPGPYTFAVESVPAAPEHAPATLAAGDSVTSEAIDYPGDWDEFTLTGSPGQKVSLAFTVAAAPGNPVLEVFDSTADSVIASAVGQPGVQVAGPVAIPSSGQLTVRVYEPRPGFGLCTDSVCNGIFTFAGGYKIVTSVVP